VAQVVSLMVKFWPTEQQVKFLGASLAAGISVYLPRGAQEMALGRFLCTVNGGGNARIDDVKLELFYKKDLVDAAQKNRWRTLEKGHLWDLAHKVLAATTFYLTSRYSLVEGIKVFLPVSLRTSSIAQAAFQTLASSVVSNNFLLRFHILDLTPVVFKIAHFLLDVKSVRDQGRNQRIEYWKEKAYDWEKKTEALWYLRLAIVACGAAGGVTTILGFIFVHVLKTVLKVGYFYTPNTPWNQIMDLAMAAASGLTASLTSLLQPPPSRLSELKQLSQRIDANNGASAELEAIFKDLKTARQQGNLGWDEFDHVCGVMQIKLEKILSEQIYPAWMGQHLIHLSLSEEAEIRKIHGPEGIFEKLCENPSQSRLERMRFFTMLLCVNLRRLRIKVEEQTVTPVHAEQIQNCLYFQTLSNILGKIGEMDLMICNIGQIILSNYRKLKKLHYANDQQVKEAIDKDPFFKPIFEMLPLIKKMPEYSLSSPLQLFFCSLTTYLEKNPSIVPAIEYAHESDSQARQDRNVNTAQRDQAFNTHFQCYSHTPDAASKTFDDIVTLCQSW
jgi:hypothetical protein